MAHPHVQSLLAHFNEIFAICKFLGLYPYDWKSFRVDQTLKKSKQGVWFVVASMIFVIVFYNLLIYSFADEDRTLKANQSTLTFVIGLFLTYIGLVMMATDQLNAIHNQNNFGDLFERIRAVDKRLFEENVIIDNSRILIRIRILILFTVFCELSIMIATYITLVDYTQWMSILWIFSCIPTFYNSLDKIWFAVILYSLKQRFEAINTTLDDMVEKHEQFKTWLLAGGGVSGKLIPAIKEDEYEDHFGYLKNDNFPFDISLLPKTAKNRVAPIAHSMNSFGESIQTPKRLYNSKSMNNISCESELNNVGKVEEKLNNFCQLHDEICEIGKTLNEIWSYPILVLMAYGFLIFTAQLYFLYCATQKQAIPSLFRSAKNAIITTVYLGYAAGKCIYLIYLSWRTSLESKRTGICLHKCGVVADENMVYEIVNHLSLKLLNHSVDFSACGFFTLDMETLYGVSGGITSYLIILIQFNLAAQQAKDALQNLGNDNRTNYLVDNVTEHNISGFSNLLTTTMLAITTNEFY